MHGAIERLAAVSASTPGQAQPTPAGLSVTVAVLNLGLPTPKQFVDQPKKKVEATMGDITYENTHMRMVIDYTMPTFV